uniref:Calmodulin n=1 Tax=Pelagomonas calceolata TaxID=35677 RepID=A0A7S4E8X1_9STRA|mmetsp:Transcript_4455/g.12660  ORF Transcript_4455/g.12660 Transcript_4455/m.12660 type:complete len:801 (+) Transcript_4455:238-2640(+)
MPDVAMTDRPPPAPPSESPLQERLRILRESTGSATLTPNAETYVKRAAELVHNEEGPVGQRHTIAGCALRCALQECEAAMRTGGGASAKDSIRLLRFAEELRQAIRECDEAASYAGVVDTPTVDMDEADDRPVRGCGAFWDFSEFCGGLDCLGYGRESESSSIDSASPITNKHEPQRMGSEETLQLDGHFLARGAEHCKLAAEASLTPGARQLLENTATELLAAAEEAASRRDRGAAARQFQRAALHLEIVRLLGGKPLAPALEASRRYARWRARRLSHLLENCVLEHSPEDPRTFDAAYSLTGEILGRGGYGVVLGCTRRADQEAFACKRLDLKRLSAKGLARLHEEIAALKALDHPHIVRLREVFYSDTGRTCLLVTDLCSGGELFKAVDKRARPGVRPPFTESRSAELLRQMLGVVRYMHSCGVCHRDLKLENWLFDSPDPDTATLRLVDFGLARVFGPLRPDLSKTRSKTNFDERVGSAYYCAPEVLEGIYDRRCDLWSLGVIAYMLFSGTPPFWGRSDKEILKRVRSTEVKFLPELFRSTSSEGLSLVRGLLQRDVELRLTADQALEHPFFSLYATLVRSVSGLVEGILPDQEEEPPLLDALRSFAALNAFSKLVVEVAAAHLAPARLVQLRQDFTKADLDGDGVLSLAELRSFLGDAKVDERELEALFAAADVDATQTLSFHEFVAAALVRRVELDDKMLHVAFEAIDSEGLGYITREAVVATMGRDAKRYGSTAEVDAALAHAGVGGRVDYNEFLDYIHEQRLSGIGSVSSEETKDERTGSTSPEIPSVIYKF